MNITTEQQTLDERLAPPVIVNPLEYPQWDAQLEHHPDASFFCGAAWARVLCETYGHNPVFFCRFSGGGLTQLLPVMEVSSPLTGRRGVSLPFSDLCPAIGAVEEESGSLYAAVIEYGRRRNWRYFEVRGGIAHWLGATPSVAFFGHIIHLEGGESVLFKRLDGAMRRGIRKAESGGIQIEFANTLEAIRIFYALHCRTRSRHGLPPQPIKFFENIGRYVLEPGQGFVAIAWHEGAPVSAAIFFQKGRCAIYKFGASDYAFQRLRPNNLLMWAAMKHCFSKGISELHLGRTSLFSDGLRQFKLGFGAAEERIEYARYNLRRSAFVQSVDRAEGILNVAFRSLPLPLLRLAGGFLYGHLS
jgi:hypothetical protein